MVAEQQHDFEVVDMPINMGPQHPSTHGVFRMVLVINGEKVVDVTPHIGYMHRGGEKLMEAMDFRQGIGYADRTEYLAQFSAELGYCLAVEKLMGIEVPERAEYIRVILTELNRLSSHFMFMGAFGIDSGLFGTSFTYAFREREYLQDIFEEVSGDRLMYAYFRVGGLAWEVTDNFVARVHEVLKKTQAGIKDLDDLLTTNEIFMARCQNVGAFTADRAIAYGLSGPLLRASGVNWDLRRDEPYSIYPRFKFQIPVGNYGDVYDRYLVRLAEMRESVSIVEQALEQLPADGPIVPEKMPRRLRTPPGEVYAKVESPRGEWGVYLVSKGGDKPYRLKMRSPSFCNLSALREMTIGQFLADAVMILGSMDIVLCDVDR
ncbi:MAG TPA: NADH-quinone oxidoreductase subunit D [Dehalococcoidia bacterium]|nr:NADH-quinone oxidoreductase subunit D [Dehalococcoidia bacterium]